MLPSFTDIRDVTICAGDTFTVGGQSLSQSGQITFPGETRAGCDSTLIYRVQVKPRYTTVLDTAICVGEQLKIGNTFFSSPGRFQYTFPENNVRCDSVIEILLAFKDTFRIHTETTICAGDTLLFGTQTIFDAGSYEERFPENNRRCDSLVFLDVTMLKPSFDTLNLELCPGDVLFFGSVRVDGPGTYDAQLLSANGCDSLLHIRVTPRAPQNTILEETVCEIDGYLFDGKIIRQSGIYQDTLRASNGCDSIITLQLTIEPTLVSKSEATICQGENYLFSGNRISEPGLYRDSFLAQTGCYFYLELDLTVLPNFSDTTFAEICSGQTYDFENQSYSRSGLFTQAYESIGGCDSIRYLQLTVNEPIIQSFEQQICNGDTFYYHELELTESGTYRDTLLNINGCDSIIEIQLDVFVPQHDTFNITLCGEEAYEFAGQFIDSAGIYTDTLSSNLGCDSIITIDVTFIDSPKNLITVGGILMQANIENANYQWINCRDTTPIVNAVSQFFIPSSNGEYAVLIEDENCTYLSECFQMIVGEDDSTITSAPFVPDISNQFRLYPNPVQSWISLEWTGEPGQNMEWQILDATGKVFAFTGMHSLEKNSQISVAALPAGMYWIYLRSDTGAIARLRFIRME